jgi:hypothetical protein
MKFLKYPVTILIILFVLSCSSDDKMEKRIIALERRVAALEVGSPAASRSRTIPSSWRKIRQPWRIILPKSEIVFENVEFDFGTINEGDVIEHTFHLYQYG